MRNSALNSRDPKAVADLVDRVRAAFERVSTVTEKRMFGSTGFLIGGKLAIGARPDRIMCRVDPQLDTDLAKEPGCRPVVMKGRTMKGYWYVEEKALRGRAALDRWIALVLQQNRSLPASKKAAAASAPRTSVGSRARKASAAQRTR